MRRFDRIGQILDRAVEGIAVIGPHGPFWRGRTVDQFVTQLVRGRVAVVPGDPENSRLVQALEGRAPFGVNLQPPTPGATLRRMPPERPPVPQPDIDYIRRWIADGCPDDEEPTVVPAPVTFTTEQHNAFWREFDDWAMFSASEEVQIAEDAVMTVGFSRYLAMARGGGEVGWTHWIADAANRASLDLLAVRQLETVRRHYGNPIQEAGLLSGFELFGRGELPPDPQRPLHPNHQMDGEQMWFIWAAFVDACIRAGIETADQQKIGRGVLVGTLNDGVFRQRFNVVGFTRDDAGKAAMRNHVSALGGNELLAEFRARTVESGMFP